MYLANELVWLFYDKKYLPLVVDVKFLDHWLVRIVVKVINNSTGFLSMLFIFVFV